MWSKGLLWLGCVVLAATATAQETSRRVVLDAARQQEAGITVETAGAGTMGAVITLPGEIKLDPERVAHIVPRLEGMAKEVLKKLGDEVRAGDVMAVIDSRELADAKAEYLAARERVALYQVAYNREQDLFKKRISPEQDFLEARQRLAEGRINQRSAEQKLQALGFSADYIEKLPSQPQQSLTRFEVVAPFDGTVIAKHVVRGEVVKADMEIFQLADLDTVLVDLNVYQKDLPFVVEGLRVHVSGVGFAPVSGVIDYVGPIVGEASRTALARVMLPNPEGELRPGLYINAEVETARQTVDVSISDTAVQQIENRPHVFVVDGDGFVARPVTVGAATSERVAVMVGLSPGEQYAATGTFLLKAELLRSEAAERD
jgi:cobalt-zinc-cadmium efflux system membrane fusion protein